MIVKIFTGRWSAYVSGFGIAFLFMLALYVLDSPVGLSDAYLMISEYCQETIHSRIISEPPFLDWQTGFLGGIFLGALIAAVAGGDWKLRMIPESGEKGAFAAAGTNVLTGLAGGFLVMLGLQISGDSFLGQWAGAVQLSTGSWIFFISVLVWGIVITSIIAAKFSGSSEGDSKTQAEKKQGG